MGTKTEPKDFKIENWGKDTIEKLYQAWLLEFLKNFNGHNDKITQEFIEHFVTWTNQNWSTLYTCEPNLSFSRIGPSFDRRIISQGSTF